MVKKRNFYFWSKNKTKPKHCYGNVTCSLKVHQPFKHKNVMATIAVPYLRPVRNGFWGYS